MSYPMVGLGLNYSIIGKSGMSVSEMNGKDMVMPMVSVTLPVYRKKYNAMASEADFSKSASLNKYNSTAGNLQTEYYSALQQYKDALRRAKLYDYQSQLASKSLDITIRSFSASAASLTDLLRIRQQTFDYELKESEAQADLNTAVALLKRLMAISEIKEEQKQ
jgi:outer membrane protein TolC